MENHKKEHHGVKQKYLVKDMHIWSKGRTTPKAGEDFAGYHARVSAFFALKKLDAPHGPVWFSCECVPYFECAICKHSLGVTIHKRLVEVPPEYVGKSLDVKKRKGRPAHVGHCLKK